MGGSSETDKSFFKACRACRRKRTRCDGQRPCQRCQQWSTECLYEQRPRETKSRLRDERAELQSYQRAANTVLHALASGQKSEAALESLWRQESVYQTALKLNRTERHAPIDEHESPEDDYEEEEDLGGDESDVKEEEHKKMQHDEQLEKGHASTPSSPEDYRPSEAAALSDTTERQDGRIIPRNRPRAEKIQVSEHFEAQKATRRASQYSNCSSSPPLIRREKAPDSACSITLNTAGLRLGESSEGSPVASIWNGPDLQILPFELVQKLFSVFGRQYIPFPTIQRHLFMRDFHQGSRDYCSSALLRSILCLACRVVGGYDASTSFYTALGDSLYAETNLLLASTNPIEYCVPDAQALSNLSLHQLGLGEYADAQSLADESVRRIDIAYRRQNCEDQDMPKHTKTALFGAVSFARMVRLLVEYLSTSASLNSFDTKKPFSSKTVGNVPSQADAHVEQLLASSGLAEANPLPEDCRHAPSFTAELTGWVYSFTCRSQVVDKNLPRQLRDTYRACLSWYQTVMDNTHNEDLAGPLVHLYYHFCLLALFRPYRYVPNTNLDISPKEICAESGAAILALAKSCYDLGTHHLSCFVPLFVHAVGLLDIDDNHLRNRPRAAGSMDSIMFQQPSPFSDGTALLASPLPSPSVGFLVERVVALLEVMGNIYPCARASRAELQRLLDNREEMVMDDLE